MSGRRQQREYAIKILFAHFSNEIDLNEVINNLLESDEKANQGIGRLCRKIAEAGRLHRKRSDELILPRLKNWELNRLPKIDRVILWVAIGEMISMPDTPKSVIINEYLELAKKFSTEKSKRFINGILDSVAKEICSV